MLFKRGIWTPGLYQTKAGFDCAKETEKGTMRNITVKAAEEDDFFEPSLECRVCHENYSSEGSKVPRLLHGCGHTICDGCLLTLLNQHPHYAGNQLAVLCPFDRTPTVITQFGGVSGLKKNYALVELLESLQGTTAVVDHVTTTDQSASSDPYDRERLLGIPCDEVDSHLAVLYCVVCSSNLCLQCSEETHRSKVLVKHRRVPLSEKPQDRPKCPFHSAYALEFFCQEADCGSESRLMCLLCRDYGRHSGHRHSLLEIEACQLRHQIQTGLTEFRNFVSDLIEWAAGITGTIEQVEGVPEAQVDGTAEESRRQVRQHFTDLRDLLLIQETAALTVVEAHIRDRAATLRKQLDELTAVTSQVSIVCTQLDKSSQLDDARLVGQKLDMVRMIDSVRKQKADCADLPNQLLVDPSIRLTFTKDNRVHIGPNVEMRVVVLGLDNAGKTTIVFKLKQNEIVSSVSTIGFNVETLEYKNLKLTLWDVGGLPKLRPLWKHYYLNTQALIFVVDSADRERLVEVQGELVNLLSENELRDAALLVLANKQDCQNSLCGEEMVQTLTLHKLCYGRSWHIQPCDALSGQGLWDGIEWLARQLISNTLQPSTSVSPVH